ncbi:zinc-binding protein A33 [Alosa sapidissima]|uniref:zinc-binding protein A33 n=1 Tax=Alosa sapidissima TaxID=34773 RepID=UPI001C083613|nr:zinc-binding protein A33 [Alosa sapidissima]
MSTVEKKVKKTRLQDPENITQNSSTGAVRWALPYEFLHMHSSAPTKITTRKPKDLKDLRGLQECTKFIINWKQQVENVCKNSRTDAGSSKDQKDQPSSLERSRKLILKWAEQLKTVDALFSDVSEEKKATTQSDNTEVDQRIIEWAKELQRITESCGLMREEILQALRLLELRKKKLMMTLLPFLEFITWSMLKEDRDSVSQLWLVTKQRTWKTETPKYIPNSVWDWICSASVNVMLDTMTNHPWLIVSDDRKRVQEAHTEIEVSFSAQRFDGWPCVLGWEGMVVGRHYWEVQLANNGYWRLGLTTASSKRQGRFTMCPEEGYWTLWRSTRQFYACTTPETPLPQELVPTRMGIYLDYDEGQISFYNVETRSHIFTFKGTFREKLYPLFAPLDGRTLMTISSPEITLM